MLTSMTLADNACGSLPHGQQDLHDINDQLQIGLGQVHEAIAHTYFLQPAAQEGQTQAQG